jgi:prepilin-type N-terminal cleavage/methylation domain-containing protein
MTSSPLKPQASGRGFTLVEMLVAMVLTLILVTSIAQFYAIIGDSVKDGRAMIEVSGRVRAAVNRLHEDLQNLTCPIQPWTDDGRDAGYFEYLEGRGNDFDANGEGTADATGTTTLLNNGVTTAIGDGDDLLGFTIRSLDKPLTGRLLVGANTTITSSQFAEVVWWMGFTDLPDPSTGNPNGVWDFNEPRFVYRRQLLIRPDLTFSGSTYAELLNHLQNSDISLSLRYNPSTSTYSIKANSLSDLSRRENRFGHMPFQGVSGSVNDAHFPHSAVTITPGTFPLLLPSFSARSPSVIPGIPAAAGERCSFVLQGEAEGEDIMLSSALAFDVQAYDPYVKIWPDINSVTSLLPDDPGYNAAAVAAAAMTNPSSTMIGMGGFVDLNFYRSNPTGVSSGTGSGAYSADVQLRSVSGFEPALFGDQPFASVLPLAKRTTFQTNAGYNAYPFGATYDTWAISYERDGIDQYPTEPTYDLASNGADDNSQYGTDDVSERETNPPYADALRGLRVRIRVYEPSTRLVRLATVATDFLNE